MQNCFSKWIKYGVRATLPLLLLATACTEQEVSQGLDQLNLSDAEKAAVAAQIQDIDFSEVDSTTIAGLKDVESIEELKDLVENDPELAGGVAYQILTSGNHYQEPSDIPEPTASVAVLAAAGFGIVSLKRRHNG